MATAVARLTMQGRTVLQGILQGRLTFKPRADGYDFSGPTRFDKLFMGVVVRTAQLDQAERSSRDEHIEPVDTLDLDYGNYSNKSCLEKVGVPNLRGLEPDDGLAAPTGEPTSEVA